MDEAGQEREEHRTLENQEQRRQELDASGRQRNPSTSLVHSSAGQYL